MNSLYQHQVQPLYFTHILLVTAPIISFYTIIHTRIMDAGLKMYIALQ